MQGVGYLFVLDPPNAPTQLKGYFVCNEQTLGLVGVETPPEMDCCYPDRRHFLLKLIDYDRNV